MAKKKRTFTFQYPIHITNRCINRDWFSMPLEEVWNIMEDYLFLIHKTHEIKIHSFVLMQNHFHLLASAPNGNLSLAMRDFLANTSLQVTKDSGRLNQLWAHRYKSCEIVSGNYFHNTYKYIYQNPLRAGVCQHVEKYPYSTLSGLLGFSKLIIPLEPDRILFDGDLTKNLKWLNTMPCQSDSEAMKVALSKQKYKLPKINSRRHHLENDKL